MANYDNIDFQEAAMFLHIVESAAKVQNLQSLSNAALTRLREIDAACLDEIKALAKAKADEAASIAIEQAHTSSLHAEDNTLESAEESTQPALTQRRV